MTESKRKTKSVAQSSKPKPTTEDSRNANNPVNRLMGSVKIVGDLEEADRYIAALCKQAITKSVENLE